MAVSNPPTGFKFDQGDLIAKQCRIEKQLGEGGMAAVYLATDTWTDKKFALKFPLQPTTDHLAALSNEVKVGQHVRHANICKTIRMHETEDGIIFAIMEYIPGEDMQQVLLGNMGPCDLADGLRWAGELCAGVNGFQRENIVHRDLKPANLMVNNNDPKHPLKIMDFGLAARPGTRSGRIEGTPHYMPPEQLLGNAAMLKSDMYAVGVILYEMFTGVQCLQGGTIGEILESQKTLPQRRPSVVAGVDARIEERIMKCLQKNPEARPDPESLREEWEQLKKDITH